jgi:hypothetical protein
MDTEKGKHSRPKATHAKKKRTRKAREKPENHRRQDNTDRRKVQKEDTDLQYPSAAASKVRQALERKPAAWRDSEAAELSSRFTPPARAIDCAQLESGLRLT